MPDIYLCIFANFKPDVNSRNNFANSYKQCPSVRKKNQTVYPYITKRKQKKFFCIETLEEICDYVSKFHNCQLQVKHPT